MKANLANLLWPLAVAACYSPNNDPSASATAGGSESSTAESTDPTMPTTMTSGSTAVGTSATADSGSTGADDESTSEDPSRPTGTDATSGGPAVPFCGDGTVDPNEDCDNGEDNALTAACRPDCTMARCGDGDIWAGEEGCDDGDGDNVLEIGACAPDCSGDIEVRTITQRGNFLVDDGDFGNNPVASADARCLAGEVALFAYPNVREAALDPFDTSRSLDWVLLPFTAYTNDVGDLVWITDDVALLGVRDGGQQPLLAAIEPCVDPCLQRNVSGLADGWLTRITNTCSLWTDGSIGDARVGDPYATEGFLDSGESRGCDDFSRVGVYCVEQ